MPAVSTGRPDNSGTIGQESFLPTIEVQADVVNVFLGDSRLLSLPHLWLRDNCPCDDCRVAKTQEKSFIVSNVAVDICPLNVSLVNGLLMLQWPDFHETEYKLDDLLSISVGRAEVPQSWSAHFSPEYFDWTRFLTEDKLARSAITSFVRDGVIIIESAPTTPDALEILARRLGPIREVLFERIHNVCVDTHVYNVAHTPMALPPHNDFASYTQQPSAQALHMLENDAEGGQSIIVDAWQIAETIRQERPDFFDILRRFPVPFREFDEHNETYTVQPIIRCNAAGKLVGVRFSNQLMQTIDPSHPEVAEFYRAYHDLCSRITDANNSCRFRLEGGQVLLVSAHRVLHAREAFVPSGKRHLQDAYFDYDNIVNKLVTLNASGGC
jgi:gamma-butyrobetaine dioxygenase